MDQYRMFSALFLVCAFPPATLYWFFVHPFAPQWRQLHFNTTRLVLTGLVSSILFVCIWLSPSMIGADWGSHTPLIALAILVVTVSAVVDLKAQRHLKIYMLLGYNELKADAPQRLLTEGIYARTRNPRYLSVMIGVVGWSLLVNYSGVYVMCVLCIAALIVIARLEEMELSERFGEEYMEYKQRVPFLLPAWKIDPAPGSSHDSP